MKKFLGLFLMILSLFTLIGCGKDDKEDVPSGEQPSGEKQTFKEYLAENGSLTIADIDANLNKELLAELPADSLAGLQIDNLELIIETKVGNNPYEEEARLYGWQVEDKYYFCPYYVDEQEADQPIYLNFTELEGYYDYGKEYANEMLGQVSVSQLLEQMISELVYEYELEDFDIDLANILEAISFDYDDFVEENGAYKLKLSSLYEKVEHYSKGALTKAQIEAMLAQYGISAEISLAFDGYHFTNFKVAAAMVAEGMTLNASIELALSYKGDALSGAKLDVVSPFANGSLNVKVEENKVSYSAEISMQDLENPNNLQTITLDYSVSDTELVMLMKVGDIVVYDCKLNYSLEGKLSISGYAIQWQMPTLDPNVSTSLLYYSKTTINSGSSVVVPQACLNNMKDALNVTEIEFGGFGNEAQPAPVPQGQN